MEAEVQAEQVFEEVELSPLELFQQQWRQQPGFIPFIKQRNVIDQNPELLPYAGVLAPAGWASPRAFAFQGLVVAAIVLSFLNWYKTHDQGKVREEIVELQANVQAELKRQQGSTAAAEAERKRILTSPKSIVWKTIPREEALREVETSLEESHKSLEEYTSRMALRERDLRAKEQAVAIAGSGTPLIFSVALMLAAGLIASGVRRDYPKSNVRPAGDYYLYLATAYGVLPNLGFVAVLHLVFSGFAWGVSGIADSMGLLFWLVFLGGFYYLLLRYFAVVSRDMYKALQIRPPASQWSADNKLLLRVHNSFLAAFVMIDAAFLSLTYLYYVVARHFA
jgi:hypothetical protein